MMSYEAQTRNWELALEELENRQEELRDKWIAKLGHYAHSDIFGNEWFDEMSPEDEELGRWIVDEIDSIQIQIEELEELLGVA